MRDKEFRALLDLAMVSDPWPLDEGNHETVIGLLERESKQRGHDGWIHAYHEFEVTLPDSADGIEIVSWGEEREFVEVDFPNGVRYQFRDVPPDVQEEWLAANTAEYYQENIRGEYRYVRVRG